MDCQANSMSKRMHHTNMPTPTPFVAQQGKDTAGNRHAILKKLCERLDAWEPASAIGYGRRSSTQQREHKCFVLCPYCNAIIATSYKTSTSNNEHVCSRYIIRTFSTIATDTRVSLQCKKVSSALNIYITTSYTANAATTNHTSTNKCQHVPGQFAST